ncbi:MAG: hypothetical protein HY646_07635, partial [Acidobacteria bacterium]|nr:hypothetical protein [Acidobacteriota bacterium]
MRRSTAGCATAFAVLFTVVFIGWVTGQTSLQVGYCVYTADVSSGLPVGTALFRVSDSAGVVVSEAGVAAAEPIRSGRIFVDEVGTKMGLAVVNANASNASITFMLRNASGTEIARKISTLGPNKHMAAYVAALFPNESVGLRGSLTFESDQALAAVTLRENRNSRNEPLYTTLPVVNLAAATSTDPVVFPHIAAGGGFTTELLLMNPTASTISVEVRFYGSDGQPIVLDSGNQIGARIPYMIPAHGIFRAALTAASLVSGWA